MGWDGGRVRALGLVVAVVLLGGWGEIRWGWGGGKGRKRRELIPETHVRCHVRTAIPQCIHQGRPSREGKLQLL